MKKNEKKCHFIFIQMKVFPWKINVLILIYDTTSNSPNWRLSHQILNFHSEATLKILIQGINDKASNGFNVILLCTPMF